MSKILFEDEKCRMCGKVTKMVVNISFNAIPICESCCNAITKQNTIWLINSKIPKLEAQLKEQEKNANQRQTNIRSNAKRN